MSESSYHKSRAGTAYSVANRLVKFNLIEPFAPDEESHERSIRITESGVDALREWLTPPIPMPDIAHSADLIRLRFFFLGALEPSQRIAFIDSSLVGLQEFLGKCEELIPKNEEIGDYFGVLATLSTVLETRARIEWLLLVREWVQRPSTTKIPWESLISTPPS